MASFLKISTLVALAVSLQSAYAAPPACLLACVAQVEKASDCSGLNDISCVCTSNGSDVEQCLKDICPNGQADDAISAFESTCSSFGDKVASVRSLSSSKASSSTKASSSSTTSSSTEASSTEASSTEASSTEATTSSTKASSTTTTSSSSSAAASSTEVESTTSSAAETTSAAATSSAAKPTTVTSAPTTAATSSEAQTSSSPAVTTVPSNAGSRLTAGAAVVGLIGAALL
ncbi:uncharacterized protein SPAPADRAFT_63763 [Spathaspora passalidarum NRRL Y-27907]|uniref:CFEM domain-containing protein n=1 Tax=Spathaspora passalidarum (strain NRRL Y-27907 / 11-Y1) TaxID=619300 RepID=G3AVD5_SPAPN|nr:uncharacterized protein SPAPADRAFT_63763 [Spathaspora passalidarum NRRL Y-27907]EGW30154.1 hypothetical protein SPAPADRAFT_63763 [Spathaspora passalidarum NRRL Y-27907]